MSTFLQNLPGTITRKLQIAVAIGLLAIVVGSFFFTGDCGKCILLMDAEVAADTAECDHIISLRDRLPGAHVAME